MSQEHSVSRRASLKGLGAVSAMLVLGGPAAATGEVDQEPAGGARDKQTLNVVDVATSRFAKGHS